MDNQRIDEIAVELFEAAPKEAAKADLGGEDGNISLVANRAGLLRLVAELLSAATAPLAANREIVRNPGELGYLFVKGQGFINTIARTERVELPEPSPPTRVEKIKRGVALVVVLAILLFLVASTVTGCTVIMKNVL